MVKGERGEHAEKDHGPESNPGRCHTDWALMVGALPGEPAYMCIHVSKGFKGVGI